MHCTPSAKKYSLGLDSGFGNFTCFSHIEVIVARSCGYPTMLSERLFVHEMQRETIEATSNEMKKKTKWLHLQ